MPTAKPYRVTRRNWVKLWVNEWLDGTTRYEMSGAQRAFWIDLLALAGRSRFPGIVCAGSDDGERFIGYPLRVFHALDAASEIDLEETLKLFEKTGKVRVETTALKPVKLIKIEILNWGKYQSEYSRQKPYRKVTKKVTTSEGVRLLVEGEGEGEVEGEGEKPTAQASPSPCLPEWVPVQEWKDYKEMRRRIKRPLTERGEQLAVSRLGKLRGEGNDPKAVLEQSVFNSWQGLYPPGGNGRESRQQAIERRNDEVCGVRLVGSGTQVATGSGQPLRQGSNPDSD